MLMGIGLLVHLAILRVPEPDRGSLNDRPIRSRLRDAATSRLCGPIPPPQYAPADRSTTHGPSANGATFYSAPVSLASLQCERAARFRSHQTHGLEANPAVYVTL